MEWKGNSAYIEDELAYMFGVHYRNGGKTRYAVQYATPIVKRDEDGEFAGIKHSRPYDAVRGKKGRPITELHAPRDLFGNVKLFRSKKAAKKWCIRDYKRIKPSEPSFGYYLFARGDDIFDKEVRARRWRRIREWCGEMQLWTHLLALLIASVSLLAGCQVNPTP